MAARAALASITFLAWAGAAPAIERIVLEVAEISAPQVQLRGARVVLDLAADEPAISLGIGELATGSPATATLTDLRIRCAGVVIHEPRFACRRARVMAQGGPTGSLDLEASAAYDSAVGTLQFDGTGQKIAGGSLRFAGTLAAQRLAVRAFAEALEVPAVRRLIAPWAPLAEQSQIDGRLNAELAVTGRPGALRLNLAATTTDLDFSNEAGSIVAEKVALHLKANARQAPQGFEIDLSLSGKAGQSLAGPVLLNFGTNPLALAARGRLVGGLLTLGALAIEQRDLLTARGDARVRFDGGPVVEHAHVELTSVHFPAAYTSFLQIALAATDFGTLEAAGTASATIDIARDAVSKVAVHINDLDLHDDRTQFMMSDLRGALHWVPDESAAVADSQLAWSRMRAYGLSGGTARLDLRARGLGFELLREARVPIFDGAVVIHSLAARNLGSGQSELDFDADIEPISMTLLSKAFGWPELSGHLAGRIPGLTYRNGVLALNGDLTANVFDGVVTGRNFRLQDPLGPWPRLFADVSARQLDLELVTSTFSIGSITGRLDADLARLELFSWSPVAFDARLYSSPGDRSPRRISQKAVTSISSIGGGSGGVTKALQSGVLRFFEQFRYDRIGIACQLRNEVCLMSGVEPRGAGYYIVKGQGLPRIDIIGNAGRVDWPQLVTQIVAGMKSENVIVQ